MIKTLHYNSQGFLEARGGAFRIVMLTVSTVCLIASLKVVWKTQDGFSLSIGICSDICEKFIVIAKIVLFIVVLVTKN